MKTSIGTVTVKNIFVAIGNTSDQNEDVQKGIYSPLGEGLHDTSSCALLYYPVVKLAMELNDS
jgi:hypothetical protein